MSAILRDVLPGYSHERAENIHCELCEYGVLHEHEALEQWSTLYERRAVGYKLGTTEFCLCSSGRHQNAYAKKMWDTHGNKYMLHSAEQCIAQWEQVSSHHID